MDLHIVEGGERWHLPLPSFVGKKVPNLNKRIANSSNHVLGFTKTSPSKLSMVSSDGSFLGFVFSMASLISMLVIFSST